MKCTACSRPATTKQPRCPHCGRWGTIARWRPVGEVERRAVSRISTGVPELDRLLGGGWVPGCVYRLSGAPGSGKSTLALDIAARGSAAYAAAEESEQAILLRFDRLFPLASNRDLLIGEVTSVEEVDDIPEDTRVIVVDSLHRLRSPSITGAAGSNSQLLHAIEGLVAFARAKQKVILAISHVNREGDASGTTGVDHDADALLEMTRPEDDTSAGTLRVEKNRHGPAPRTIGVRLHETGIRYEETQERKTKNTPKRKPRAEESEEVHS